jgi:hypothetical protein
VGTTPSPFSRRCQALENACVRDRWPSSDLVDVVEVRLSNSDWVLTCKMEMSSPILYSQVNIDLLTFPDPCSCS